MTHVVRPSTVPTAVTTASPGRPSLARASSPSSKSGGRSKSRRMRSRTSSWPLARTRSRAPCRNRRAGPRRDGGAVPHSASSSIAWVARSRRSRRSLPVQPGFGHLQEEGAQERHHDLAALVQHLVAQHGEPAAGLRRGPARRTSTSAWIVSPNARAAGGAPRRGPTRPARSRRTCRCGWPGPRARARVSGPWAMRCAEGGQAAYSASVCSGTQSPVSRPS